MPLTAQSKDKHIRIKQFITDTKGQKMAAVIDMDELKRIETVLNIIPPPEAWICKNKKALESVQRGLKEAAKGKLKKLNLDEL